jgi:hypothetical protein
VAPRNASPAKTTFSPPHGSVTRHSSQVLPDINGTKINPFIQSVARQGSTVELFKNDAEPVIFKRLWSPGIDSK